MTPLPLGDMPLDTFLAEYWQKKPLLIKAALRDVDAPLDANSLAGLACEEGVESRLIVHQETPQSAKGSTQASWQLSHGPFDENTFAELPSSHWTLLVQAVDHWVPEAAAFLELFNFIPRWRIDDLMMSYAADGGGVGPHYDHYDVFLVQVSGRRKWEVGGCFDDASPLCKDVPVKILEGFEAEQSWVLEAGDILYLPPGIGHNGVAQGDDCLTCSVGFRAPSHAEMLRDFTDFIGEGLTESERYSDPDLVAQENTGEITAAALAKVRGILTGYINDDKAIANWFAGYVTAPKYGPQGDDDLDEQVDATALREHLESGGSLARNEGARFAFVANRKNVELFVDGERAASCAKAFAEVLCSNSQFDAEQLTLAGDELAILVELLERGSLYLS